MPHAITNPTSGPQPVPEPGTQDGILDAAQRLYHMSGASYLSTEFHDLNSVLNLPLQAFDVYLQRFIEGAGQPDDPVLRILIEQLTMAHHKIARLNRLSAMSTTAEAARLYDSSAVRLIAELRHLALEIKAYREPLAPRHVTVVKQQNLAQNQQVAFVEAPLEAGNTEATAAPPPTLHTELRSKERLDYVHTIAQPPPGRRRQAESFIATRSERSRANSTASVGTHESAVASGNRSQNCFRQGASGG